MIPGVTIFEFADQTGLTLDEAADALCSARPMPVEELCMAWGFPPARAAQLAVRNLSLNAFASAKQQRWFFANLAADKGGSFGGGGRRSGDLTAEFVNKGPRPKYRELPDDYQEEPDILREDLADEMDISLDDITRAEQMWSQNYAEKKTLKYSML